jgi:hypothetical protein
MADNARLQPPRAVLVIVAYPRIAGRSFRARVSMISDLEGARDTVTATSEQMVADLVRSWLEGLHREEP